MERAAHYRAELFAYDPTEPSQLLGKWRISTQLDRKLRPLRVGVVADPISKTIGRVTVQEGDGLDGASKAMLRLGAMSATARARALRRWRPSLAASCPSTPCRTRCTKRTAKVVVLPAPGPAKVS